MARSLCNSRKLDCFVYGVGHAETKFALRRSDWSRAETKFCCSSWGWSRAETKSELTRTSSESKSEASQRLLRLLRGYTEMDLVGTLRRVWCAEAGAGLVRSCSRQQRAVRSPARAAACGLHC